MPVESDVLEHERERGEASTPSYDLSALLSDLQVQDEIPLADQGGSNTLKFEAQGHIRRLVGTTLERDFVYQTLTLAGYRVTKTQHKTHVPLQSHGRWEIRAPTFEVHLGYEGSQRGRLVDTVIRGTKGWTKQLLDDVAELLERAYRSHSTLLDNAIKAKQSSKPTVGLLGENC